MLNSFIYGLCQLIQGNKIKAIKRHMFNRASIALLGNKLTSFNT